MYGLKSIIERGRAQRLANGGRVRGPGTGTSDDIQATVPEGSYIMPADSTEQIGLGFGLPKRPTKANPDDAPKLGLRRNGVPVNLSNGEHALSPEQVHAVGAQVLDAVRDATHVPADMQARGFQQEELFFANGGAVQGGFGLKRRDHQVPAPGLGFGPTSVLARMKAERQSFADGGLAEDDPNRPRGFAWQKGNESSGTGAELARQPAIDRARDFAAGRISQNEYAATLKAPNLGYQDNTIAPKVVPSPPTSIASVFLPTPRAEQDVRSRPMATTQIQPSSPVSDAYPDETRRGAATMLPQTNAKPAGIAPFNAADLTQQQRGAAGDVYRDAWQREAPGGLQRAGAAATDLYNAEQQVRGTGITARRGANGVMEFSGDGANALPQNYTQGVDLNAANASMARANAIRAGMGDLSAQVDFNSGAALSRPKTNEELLRDMLTGPSRSGRKVAAGLIRGQQEDAQATARLGLDRERLGMDQQRVGAETEGQRLQNQRYQQESSLIDQLLSADGSESQARLIAQLRALRGKGDEPSGRDRFLSVQGGQVSTPDGTGVMTAPSRVFDTATQRYVDLPAAQQVPTYEQFARVLRSRPRNEGIPDDVILEAYRKQFGRG